MTAEKLTMAVATGLTASAERKVVKASNVSMDTDWNRPGVSNRSKERLACYTEGGIANGFGRKRRIPRIT